MHEHFSQGATGWRKATASGDSGDCVEVGGFPTGEIAVRDTKATEVGPILRLSPEAWSAFVGAVKNGEFAV